MNPVYNCENILYARQHRTTYYNRLTVKANKTYYDIYTGDIITNPNRNNYPNGVCEYIDTSTGYIYISRAYPTFGNDIPAPSTDITRFEQTIFLSALILIIGISIVIAGIAKKMLR